VNATVSCSQVRSCITGGNGVDFNQTTGQLGVCVSTNAGNLITRDGSGCLFVAPGNNTVTTGCGLSGTGTVLDPLAIEGKTWAFPCSQSSTTTTGVYCDPATGFAHGDPQVRMSQFTDGENFTLPSPLLVPVADTIIRTRTLSITNPDNCRSAKVIFSKEVDVDLDLPPGGGGAYGIDSDDTAYLENRGTATIFATHVQTTRMFFQTIAAGATSTITYNVTAARGVGGATITRIQTSMRAWIISNP
jgi:hypothetical protein